MNTMTEPTDLPGWGIDADESNNPTHPMKKRNNGEHAGRAWERPTQQERRVEVLHSNERPNLTAVYGTATPPSGLSGAIRRGAFKYSESSYGHWLPLMLADRINMVEGVITDIARGRIPNIFKELGWRAEWRYNRSGLLMRIGVQAAIAGLLFAALRRPSRRRVPRRRRLRG